MGNLVLSFRILHKCNGKYSSFELINKEKMN